MPDSTCQQGDGQFEASVIGAGVGGLYALHRLRDTLGMKVRVLEAGGSVGRTSSRDPA
jgi:cation diffusion facilitator CzcD-associated flavoprotein CzcO